jgi:hypothetical protein
MGRKEEDWRREGERTENRGWGGRIRQVDKEELGRYSKV